MSRILLICLGWLAVTLGTIGVFLPLLPTTPFLLVAAWAFARSSPRFRTWLITHQHFGPMISEWQENGAIPLKAKVLGVLAISVSMAWLIGWSNLPITAVAAAGVFLAGAATFIVSRPTARN